MNADKFIFPAYTGLGETKHLTIEWTSKVEDFMDQLFDHIDELKSNGLTPKYIIVGKNQYKQLVAWMSYAKQQGILPKDVDGVPLVVLDKNDYLDVLPDVEDMFTKMVKDDGKLV